MTGKEEAAAALRDAQMQHRNSMLNMFSQQNMGNIHPEAAAQDPELAKYQRAMPNKPLTKPPGHYLTSDEGSKCEQIQPVSVQWRKEFENKADTFDEESYSDGYSQGYAAGMNYVSKPYTEAQKAKNREMRDMVDKVETAQMGIDTDKFRKECLEGES